MDIRMIASTFVFSLQSSLELGCKQITPGKYHCANTTLEQLFRIEKEFKVRKNDISSNF